MAESGKNTEKTPKLKGGKGMLKGIESGPGFTKDNQPSPEAKRAGKFKAKLLREVLAAPVSKKTTPEIDKLIRKVCEVFGMRREDMDNRILIELRIAQMAFEHGDEKRYRALMDRILGKPRNEGIDEGINSDYADRKKSQFDLGPGMIFEV